MEAKEWDNYHTNNTIYWLTNSKLYNLAIDHNIDFESYKNKKILEIGIGTGKCVEELKSYTNEIYACDVSKIALKRVSSFAKTYTTVELNTIEPVDLAICHLVFQHCDNKEVKRIINEVNLTPNGIFSFQYAYLSEKKSSFLDKNIKINNTHFFRSPEKMRKIINTTNKQINGATIFKSFPDLNWEIIKVKNET